VTTRLSSSAASLPHSMSASRSAEMDAPASSVGLRSASTTAGSVPSPLPRPTACSSARSSAVFLMRDAAVERVEPQLSPRSQSDHFSAAEARHRPVLPLGVHHHDAPPEHPLPETQRLHQCGLAAPQLTGDHHVGRGEHPLLVELERVVGERTAEQIAPDVGAAPAEAALRDERIRALQVRGGEAMGPLTPHLNPRHNGSV
jgi:hypothetical protein